MTTAMPPQLTFRAGCGMTIPCQFTYWCAFLERLVVARAQGPEEFFEALRAAKRDDGAKAAAAAPQRADEAAAGEPQPAAVDTPCPSEPRQQPRSPVTSLFASDDPSITIRRSTLIFAVIVVAVLLFIAFALGRRSTSPSQPSSRAPAERVESESVRRPALPQHLRGKSVICLKTFDRTEDAGQANARAYRDFLRTSPDAAFVKSSGRNVFILSYERELQLCVGPFDGGVGTPAASDLLQKLRQLRYNEVQQFAHADVRPVPYYAKEFN